MQGSQNLRQFGNVCINRWWCWTYPKSNVKVNWISSKAPASSEPEIPPYQQKQDEPLEVQRARLLYQSRKRGMLENDLLLSTFAAKYLGSMNEADLIDYDKLINCPSNDWDIYYWATGVKPLPLEFDTGIMRKFIQHVKNNKRETRLRQPALDKEQISKAKQ